MRASDQGDTAGIPFPPPLAFLSGLAVGFGLQHFIPLPLLRIDSGAEALAWTGTALILLGAALAASAFIFFHQARTSPFPERPSTSLIERGPFKVTRNPLYISMSLIHAGISLFANALWPLLFLAPAIFAIRRFVIAREERYLLLRFGANYESYCGRVRRWL
jgi:protein-S-isoprenylcysteine O-methyltransferase Ste14